MDLLVLVVFGVAIYAFVLLIKHGRTLARSVISVAALLFAWAAEGGCVGFAAYIAAWIFLFPVMVSICLVGGIALTWIHVSEEREARAIERGRRAIEAVSKKERKKKSGH